MPRKTKRVSKKRNLTIPELKRSFDHLDTETKKILASSATDKVARFQKVWFSIFHKSVKKEAAEAYLAIKRRSKGKTRKLHKGGAAPIDYQVRPGIDGPHGVFPAYLSQGLATFQNQTMQLGQSEECGVKNFGPSIPAGLGSNLVGGDGRPFAASVPPGPLQNLQTIFQGRELPPFGGVASANPPYGEIDHEMTIPS